MEIKICEVGEKFLITLYEGNAIKYSFYATQDGMLALYFLFQRRLVSSGALNRLAA